MLSAYLNAAKNVVQQKQARPGVAVHVRLGGDTDGGEKEGSDGVSRNGVASSYAVWAVTGEVSTNLEGWNTVPASCWRFNRAREKVSLRCRVWLWCPSGW